MKQQALEHGLTAEEYDLILDILNRVPNLTELGIFSAMWSEHCSYKSSRYWLKTLHTEEEWVVCGPGENAGVIDIGDGMVAVFKIESHNHPSYIEPFQGAATGVGGILRDVFTMGARPIAIMNALRFGDSQHPRTKYLINGVVKGISHYGNCIGIPTIGGETEFDASYNGNNLVNAMTVGIANNDNIYYSAAAGVGNKVVYVGAKTGRDGIHGASMASQEFDDQADKKRPTVQVGDPFTEKLLMEACLQLMQQKVIIAIQDMGAAGLTSSSVEMADKGHVGIKLYLDYVPMREQNMTPYELMLSESQERMLMIIKPGHEHKAQAIFDKWGLSCDVIGEVTDTNRLELFMYNELVADIPVPPLVDKSPLYQRPYHETSHKKILSLPSKPKSIFDFIQTYFSQQHGSSRQWIWQQYDYIIGGQTCVAPGGDASVVKIPHSQKALSITTDCTPRYVLQNPYKGGALAVAEAYRNIIATGAKPLAVTNNLNFGNPEKPEVMGQLAYAVQGMSAICKKLHFPVISGNVSLYNETDGGSIKPTPVIGGVGLLDNFEKACTIRYQQGNDLLLIGKPTLNINCSRYAEYCGINIEDYDAPDIDGDILLKNSLFIHDIIHKNMVTACHDISDAGLIGALVEMALASHLGFTLITPEPYCHDHQKKTAFYVAEEQAHYVIASSCSADIITYASQQEVDCYLLGKANHDTYMIDSEHCHKNSIELSYNNWFKNYMEDC